MPNQFCESAKHFRIRRWIASSLLSCLISLGATSAENKSLELVPEAYRMAFSEQLKSAGDKAEVWTSAIEKAPQDHRAAVAFLVANMPETDLKTLTSEFILKTYNSPMTPDMPALGPHLYRWSSFSNKFCRMHRSTSGATIGDWTS